MKYSIVYVIKRLLLIVIVAVIVDYCVMKMIVLLLGDVDKILNENANANWLSFFISFVQIKLLLILHLVFICVIMYDWKKDLAMAKQRWIIYICIMLLYIGYKAIT